MRNSFFDINSVAIIWASESSWKIWNDLLKNLSNFNWNKYGVNPKLWEFEWIKFYESITKLPETVDIAVIAIPAKFVISSLEEIAKNKIKRVIIISAGFKEVWNIKEEEEITEIANKNDILILWPNCLGYIDVYKRLNLSFWWKSVKSWNIAMISQSWAMAVAFTDWAYKHDLWFSKIISMWNKAWIWENELLLELENDSETKVIVMYLESIEKARTFYVIAKKLTITKPIILVKSWMSDRWSEAASSHTWALAWSAVIFKTAFKQAWIIYTSKLENFFLWWKTFSKVNDFKKVPEELAIVTNAWGPWVMITDHCEFLWLKLTEFSNSEREVLMNWLPDTASVKNPIDIIGDATSTRYSQILENLNSLEKKRAILVMLTPQTVTDTEQIAKVIVDFKKKNPDAYIMTSFMGGVSLEAASEILKVKEILNYTYPQKAVLAYSQILRYKKLLETNFEIPDFTNKLVDKKTILDLEQKIKKEDKLLSNSLTWEILEKFQINYLNEKLVNNENDAKSIFDEIWYKKLIAKISSPDIAHKTDVGWIYFNIKSNEEALKAYNSILENVNKKSPKSTISWITFAKQLDNESSNREIFVWLKRDESFGDILIVGMGWIFVNVYEDVSRRLAPVCKREIKLMLEQLKWYKILAWYRWEKSINFDSLIDNIYRLQLVFKEFRDIKEIDINPIFADDNESVIVDAKFYL